MKYRDFRRLSALLIVIIVLTGCGGGTGTDTDDPDTGGSDTGESDTDTDPTGQTSTQAVTSAELLATTVSASTAVGGTVSIDIKLDIDATGFNADNPLLIRLSNADGHFATSTHSVADFSSPLTLTLSSRSYAEAARFSTVVKVDFCDTEDCQLPRHEARSLTVAISVEPRFGSAEILSDSIDTLFLPGQTNSIDLQLAFDADGYNDLYPVYVFVRDETRLFQTQTYPLGDVSQPVALPVYAVGFDQVGEFDRVLEVTVCRDFSCNQVLQESVAVPVTITARNPIIASAPADSAIAFSQVVLESGTLDYEVALVTDDDASGNFWVRLSDSTGMYFEETIVPASFLADARAVASLAIKPIDAQSDEVHTFHIRSDVCMDRLCETVVSPEPAQTTVTLELRYPSVALSLNQATLTVNGKDNTPTVVPLTGNWQWNDLGSHPAYLVARDVDGGEIVDSAMLLPQTAEFSVPLELMPQRQLGSYATDVQSIVCLEPACEHIVGTASTTLSVVHDVNELAGWRTHQRNAEHNGYVPVTLTPDNFAESWTWSRPSNSDPVGAIHAVATENGKVVTGYDVFHDTASVVMLNETTGILEWETSLGDVPALNPPAITDGKVWAAVTGHGDTNLHAFDFASGALLHSSGFDGQWPHYFAPTPYAQSIYQGGGDVGGTLYAFDIGNGQALWDNYLRGAWDLYTPAVTDDYVVHHTGEKLMVVNRLSGATEFEIDDGLEQISRFSYYGAPLVYDGIAVAFAEGANGGQKSASIEHFDDRPLSAFDLNTRRHLWNSAALYTTHPAVKDGVIYAGSTSLGRLDAIDLRTGTVLWSWTPPDASETELHRNVVVTDNLVFVSTNTAVHAIDLVSRQSLWRYPAPGMLAMSESLTLFIATGASTSDGGLVAVSLD